MSIKPLDLTKIGLSEKESLIYIALLEMGTASASEVATHTGIQRTTVYQAVDTLYAKKIVSMTEVGSIQKFSANPPESLLAWCDTNYQIEKARMEEGKGLVSELERQFPIRSNLHSRVYQLSEMADVLEQLYAKTKKVKMFGSIRNLINANEIYHLKKIFKDAASRQVLTRVITTDTDEAIQFSKMNYMYSRETVLMSHIDEPMNDIIIFDHAVCVVDYAAGTMIVLYQPILAMMTGTMFEYMWTRCTQMGIHYALPSDITKKVYPIKK